MQDLFNFSDSERDPEYIPDSTEGDTGSETDDAKDSPGGKFRIVGLSYRTPTVAEADSTLGAGNLLTYTDYISGSTDGESNSYDFPLLAVQSENTPKLGNSGANISSTGDNCSSTSDQPIKIAQASGKPGTKYHYCVFCEKPVKTSSAPGNLSSK